MKNTNVLLREQSAYYSILDEPPYNYSPKQFLDLISIISIPEISKLNVNEFLLRNGSLVNDATADRSILITVSDKFEKMLIEPLKDCNLLVPKEFKLEKFKLTNPLSTQNIIEALILRDLPIPGSILLPTLWSMMSKQPYGKKGDLEQVNWFLAEVS